MAWARVVAIEQHTYTQKGRDSMHAMAHAWTSMQLLHAAMASVAHYGPVAISFLGVTLSVDFAEEAYFLDLAPGHNKDSLAGALHTAECLGLEVMDDDECEPELLPDGTIRRWLCERVPVETFGLPQPRESATCLRQRAVLC